MKVVVEKQSPSHMFLVPTSPGPDAPEARGAAPPRVAAAAVDVPVRRAAAVHGAGIQLPRAGRALGARAVVGTSARAQLLGCVHSEYTRCYLAVRTTQAVCITHLAPHLAHILAPVFRPGALLGAGAGVGGWWRLCLAWQVQQRTVSPASTTLAGSRARWQCEQVKQRLVWPCYLICRHS